MVSTGTGGIDASGNGPGKRFREGMLAVVGLSPGEEQGYLALLEQRSGMTALELQTALGVAGLRTETIVEALQTKGLISRAPGDEIRYVAAPPDVALDALLLEKRQQIERAELVARDLLSVYEACVGLADPARLVEVVVGREAVMQRFVQIQRTTRYELRSIDKPPYVSSRPQDNIDVEQELLARGVKVRAIYDSAGLESFHDLRDDIRSLIDYGEQARVFPDAPIKLLICDDRIAMLPLQAAPVGIESVVVVYPSALLEALSALFDQLWQRALPLWPSGLGLAAASQAPTPDELQLLGLLTAGLADEAIARRLDISARTLQRRMHALFDRLGARTRFQAALRASALGWLPTEPERDSARLDRPNEPQTRSLDGQGVLP